MSVAKFPPNHNIFHRPDGTLFGWATYGFEDYVFNIEFKNTHGITYPVFTPLDHLPDIAETTNPIKRDVMFDKYATGDIAYIYYLTDNIILELYSRTNGMNERVHTLYVSNPIDDPNIIDSRFMHIKLIHAGFEDFVVRLSGTAYYPCYLESLGAFINVFAKDRGVKTQHDTAE